MYFFSLACQNLRLKKAKRATDHLIKMKLFLKFIQSKTKRQKWKFSLFRRLWHHFPKSHCEIISLQKKRFFKKTQLIISVHLFVNWNILWFGLPRYKNNSAKANRVVSFLLVPSTSWKFRLVFTNSIKLQELPRKLCRNWPNDWWWFQSSHRETIQIKQEICLCVR